MRYRRREKIGFSGESIELQPCWQLALHVWHQALQLGLTVAWISLDHIKRWSHAHPCTLFFIQTALKQVSSLLCFPAAIVGRAQSNKTGPRVTSMTVISLQLWGTETKLHLQQSQPGSVLRANQIPPTTIKNRPANWPTNGLPADSNYRHSVIRVLGTGKL